MAEAAPVVPAALSPAHRVIIDAMAFLAAGRMAHNWDALVLDMLGEALDALDKNRAQRSGVAVLDKLAEAARVVVTARALHQATQSPTSRTDLAAALLKAAAATQDFFNARVAQSANAFRGVPIEPPVSAT